MNREDTQQGLVMYLLKYDQYLALNKIQASELARLAMKYIDKHMDPKYSGTHQSSYDSAMGSPCEWDKEG